MASVIKALLVSSSKCNVEGFQSSSPRSTRGFPVERFAWPIVKPRGDGIELALVELGKIGAPGHVSRICRSVSRHTRPDLPPALPVLGALRVSAFFDPPDLLAELKSLRSTGLANPHIACAHMHLRTSRVGPAWQAVRTALRLVPASLVRWCTARALINAPFNRTAHKLLWTVRSLFRR